MHLRSRERAARARRFRSLLSESLEPRNLFATLATFDHAPTPYIQSGPENLQFTSLRSGGATGRYMKFMEAGKEGLSALSFDRTDAFAANTVIAEFMFRHTYAERRFDAFDFALLRTSEYGQLATREGAGHLEGFSKSLSFRFLVDRDINLAQEIWTDSSLQVIYDGQIVADLDLTDVLDLHSGQWHRARFIVQANAGKVSIDITPEGRAPVRVATDLAVPGLSRYEMRAHFSNLSQSNPGQVNAGNVDLDSVSVNYLRANESYVTFDDWRPFAVEHGEPVSVKLRRFGNLTSSAQVRVKTESGSALSGADFQPIDEVITFAAGEEARQVDLVMADDFVQEDNEYFWLRAISAGPRVKTSDPMASIVRIFDDETGRQFGQALPLVGLGRTPIHTVMLPNGKVMYWGRQHDLGPQIYDPVTQEITPVPIAGHHHGMMMDHVNIFCSGHTLLPDGRVFVAGGHETDYVGTKTAFIFDPATNEWTRLPDMNERRWYPTVMALPNGDVLVLHGTIDSPTHFNEQPQVWEAATNTWRNIEISQDLAENAEAHQSNFYPRAFPMADGRIFYFGYTRQTWFLDPRPGVTDPWTRGPLLKTLARPYDYGTATEYAPGKILVAGGRPEGQADAEVIDLNQPDPQFRPVGFMNYARRQHNATVLPDGRVLITGGQQGRELAGPAKPQLRPEIWDPATETFTVQSSLSVERLYHSTGMLLPDGSVWTGGTGEPTTVDNAHDQRNMQIFQPSYMFYQHRPEITLAPPRTSYGEQIYLTVNRPLEITQVNLIRLGSVTHSLEQSADFTPVSFRQAAGGLQVDIPHNTSVITPGYYFLSVVDYRGVPSESKILQILPANEVSLVSIGNVQVSEGSGQATLQLHLTRPLPQPITVGYRTLAASAKPGSDFTAVEQTVTIPAGQVAATIQIPLINDGVKEASEWFSVDLFSTPAGVTAGNRRAQVIITDDDGETPPLISIDDGSGLEGDNVTLTVRLSSPSVAPTFIPFVTYFGAATQADLSPRAGSITIPAGATTGQISIPTKEDNQFEEDEFFHIRLVNLPGMQFSDDQALGWIVNDDPPPRLTPEALTIDEGTGGVTTALVVVRLSNPISTTASVEYATKNFTARAGSDYEAAAGTLVFAPGETVKTIPIIIYADSNKEPHEEFYVTFSGAQRAALTTSQIKVRIRNDD